MKTVTGGHVYDLEMYEAESGLRVDCTQVLTFRLDPKCNSEMAGHDGTTNQEVIRALIHRMQFLDGQKPAPENSSIIYHLRQALTLHESRALRLKGEKGLLNAEAVPTAPDGHFKLGA